MTINTQTGATERWAAGDPASVADQLDAARDQIRERPGPMATPEVLGKVRNCMSCRCGPENFSAEIGRKIARQNAVAKIWPLMGYELRTKLAAR